MYEIEIPMFIEKNLATYEYDSFARGYHAYTNGISSIFLHVIVLQTNSPTDCINNPTFRVDSRTKPILAVFSPTNR